MTAELSSPETARGFVAGPGGDIPVSCWWPSDRTARNICVIHCAAFGEEMNRSRHMVARQARDLVEHGVAVIVPDLSGTGDSPAELSDASWSLWREEVRGLVADARSAGFEHVVLWGLRLGCVLAADVASVSSPPVAALLLWQPLAAGKQQMAQFLRLGGAAAMLSEDEADGGATSAGLKSALEAGRRVEIAGYELTPELYNQINDARLDRELPRATAVALFELTPDPDRTLSAAATRLLGRWSRAGREAVGETVAGDAFWATQELGFADRLVHRSTAQLINLLRDTTVSGTGSSRVISRVPLSRRGGSGLWALSWSCADEELCGVLHETQGQVEPALGVVVVVGGPQYRVGSHRQFVYLARALAAAGIPVLRFDYRGMGDASGEFGGFLTIDDDIRSAIDTLQREQPGIERVVLWGLCDAATASFAYAPGDARVAGLVVANPWVFSEQGAARVRLARYYRDRLLSGDFWRKLRSGQVRWSTSLGEFWRTLRRVVSPASAGSQSPEGQSPENQGDDPPPPGEGGAAQTSAATGTVHLPSYLAAAAARYTAPVLLLLSGRDYTAREFEDSVRQQRPLRRALERDGVRSVRLAGADHTFSQSTACREVEELSCRFVQALSDPRGPPSASTFEVRD